MANSPPQVSDFEAFFGREFQYGPALNQVRPTDINRALAEAGILFNASLFDSTTILIQVPTLTESAIAYLYLSAHVLAKNLQGAGGLHAKPQQAGATQRGTGIVESKSVGQVSVNLAILDIARSSPVLSPFLETDFGKRYLTMLYPRLIGNVAVVSGESLWFSQLAAS